MISSWMKISLVLCIFGFLREMRPSEPFVVEFFIQYRNISSAELANFFFPLGTYSYMAQLVVVFLITDLLRYKAIIVFSSFIGMLLFGLMAWTNTRDAFTIAQISYGTFMACEVAYYTYIYAKVERDQYQMVTGHTRAAILSGRFFGAVMAQLLVSFGLMNYEQLLYISFGSQCVSVIFAICLPAVSVSLYFYSNNQQNECKSIDMKMSTDNNVIVAVEKSKNHDNEITQRNEPKPQFSFSLAVKRIAEHFRTSYSNLVVVQWSILWAMAMCGFLQVQSYIQPLWKEIDATEIDLYNGAVEALITLLGAISAFAAGFLDSKRFNQFEIWILTALTLTEGFLLLWASYTSTLWCCYIAYILFGMIYHFMITIASATIAKKLEEESFALIFGINTLIALILQSILTFVVITKYDLNLRIQYQVYAYCFFALTILFALIGTNKLFCRNKKNFVVNSN